MPGYTILMSDLFLRMKDSQDSKSFVKEVVTKDLFNTKNTTQHKGHKEFNYLLSTLCSSCPETSGRCVRCVTKNSCF